LDNDNFDEFTKEPMKWTSISRRKNFDKKYARYLALLSIWYTIFLVLKVALIPYTQYFTKISALICNKEPWKVMVKVLDLGNFSKPSIGNYYLGRTRNEQYHFQLIHQEQLIPADFIDP
jgi:glucose-6-phosphate isomerase